MNGQLSIMYVYLCFDNVQNMQSISHKENHIFHTLTKILAQGGVHVHAFFSVRQSKYMYIQYIQLYLLVSLYSIAVGIAIIA